MIIMDNWVWVTYMYGVCAKIVLFSYGSELVSPATPLQRPLSLAPQQTLCTSSSPPHQALLALRGTRTQMLAESTGEQGHARTLK
eukprot:COSAG02_NODE_7741_length_2866_cov_1.542630_3_plen_85_part_00